MSTLSSEDIMKGKCGMRVQVIDQVMGAAACAHRVAADFKEYTVLSHSLKSQHWSNTLQGGPSEAGRNGGPTEPERRVSVRLQQQA